MKKIKTLIPNKFMGSWLLAQLAGAGAYYTSWQHYGGTGVTAQTPAQNVMTVGLLAAAWMGGTGFAIRVWREIESDAVSYAGSTLRKIPAVAKRIVSRSLRLAARNMKYFLYTRQYLRRVYEDYGIFNDRGLGLINANRLDLEHVYVDLKIKSEPNIDRPKLDPLRHEIEGRHSIWTFLRALRAGYALALIGAPGTGKTTLLQHLLLTQSRRKTRQIRRHVPIFIELRAVKDAFAHPSDPTLPAVIRYYWKEHSRIGDLSQGEPKQWLEYILQDRRALILLDGLDEVPATLRKRLSAWIDRQVGDGRYRACMFLLTSRPGGFLEAPVERAQLLEVQPFSAEQAKQFIEGWYLANEIVASGQVQDAAVRRRAAEDALDLRQRLNSNPDLYALTVNPLLLTMVCMVHRYRGALPGSRAQLYGEICQVLLERWRQARNIEDSLKGEQKLTVLRPLAEQYMLRQVRDMEDHEIYSIIAEPLASVGYVGKEAPSQFLKEIQAGSGLLLERENRRWSFAHKTFQEFLTAEQWLKSANQHRDWSSLVADEWWRETLVLYSANADGTGICEAALAHATPSSWALAYQVLTEAVKLAPVTRLNVEVQLKGALRHADSNIFGPAASALLHLRMREVVPFGDTAFCRATLVTQAEYQRFLDVSSESTRDALLPIHWKTNHFTGDPEAPVLGVYPSQAEAFVKWVNQSGTAEVWRLPDSTEAHLLPQFASPAWCSDGRLTSTPTAMLPRLSEWNAQQMNGAVEWAQDADVMGQVSRIDDRTKSYAQQLSSVLDRVLRISAGINLANDLVFALGLDRRMTASCDRAISIVRAIGRGRSLRAAKLDQRQLEHFSVADAGIWRKRLKEVQPASDHARAGNELVLCALDIIEAQSGTQARVAWRAFASKAIKIGEPRLRDAYGARILLALRIAAAREDAELPPWEGIALCRDRFRTHGPRTTRGSRRG